MTQTSSRSPLLLFLMLGIGLVAVERWLATGSDGRRVVPVTHEQVEALRARWNAQWGREPTDRELQGLIDESVREGILYREALRLNLDRNDPIVRRRLARKMTFMLEDNSAASEPARRELAEYFAAHVERYREAVRMTFQHVFLSGVRRENPQRDSAGLLQELRNGPEGSWRAAGDAFALLREYSDRTEREISELFGAAFASALGDLHPSDWHGPVSSEYGTHLVRVLRRSSPPQPELEDVRERVVRDLLAARRRERNTAALQALRERYDVRLPVVSGPEERP